MNTQLLDKISNQKLTTITTKQLDEASQILFDSMNEIDALPSEEEKLNHLKLRFGFLQNSLLHLAAKFANVDLAEKILKIVGRDFKIINARNDELFTPLHLAARVGDPIITNLLLEFGAETGPQASNENRRWAPIHYAAKFGHTSVIETLISYGADKETKTGFGLTPLIIGAEFGQNEVVSLMLELGADKNAKTIEENYNMNALHYAAIGGFCDLAELLLNYGINPNQETSLGLSALDLAIKSHHSEMVDLLLFWGVGDLDKAFFIATESKNSDSLKKIKTYLNARKKFFDSKWLRNCESELIMELEKCSEENLGSNNISPLAEAPLNIYGILALKHRIGFFLKSDETFVGFCFRKEVKDVANKIHEIEGMFPKI
ncbi:MAG: ankyrin repeat domain-containing protein [Proteobacteria bacterium]|nr:ankyrin repeat domain-containing protein [Pseudomonadota bacterium]